LLVLSIFINKDYMNVVIIYVRKYVENKFDISF
jgi:hypothetical protein